MTSVRKDKVAHEIRNAVAEVLTRGGARDPRIGFITLTKVTVSADLKSARVYYSMLGTEEERLRTQEGLDAARPYFRREVGQRVKLRVVPHISFTFDPTMSEADKIDRLLRDVRTKEGW